jgi:hypothetical protein
VRTKKVLVNEYGADERLRRDLQALGEKLDVETDGLWVAEATSRQLRLLAPKRPLIVDAVRIPRQVERVRELSAVRVVLVYLTAPLKTLASRYEATKAKDDPSYEEVRKNPTEARITEMRRFTWIRFNTAHIHPWLTVMIVVMVVRANAVATAARRLAEAFALGGLFAAALTAPIGWFWFAHLDRGWAVLMSTTTFAFFATLGGSAVTQLSPIEHDVTEAATDRAVVEVVPAAPPAASVGVPDRAQHESAEGSARR